MLTEQEKAAWGPCLSLVSRAFETAARASMLERVWDKDPAVWTGEASQHAEIKKRLGWLTLPSSMKKTVADLTAFAEQIKSEGFTSVVLLGMGGSSLAPEVFAETFGPAAGFPKLRVLDSTDPEQVLSVEKSVDLKHTLFIVSSKSGGTVELVSLFKYFFDKSNGSGEQFVAITDPGSPLEAEARKNGFRRVFLSPADVGGRFSALTPFGLVPAALTGINIKRVLSGAESMMKASSRDTALIDCPAAALGLGMAALAAEGRDKLTLVCSDSLSSFGDWAEQLVAESSGKQGKGIVPVVREALGEPSDYGPDRFFVALLLGSDRNEPIEACLKELSKAGHPVLTLRLRDRHDLGAEFYRWELATALACAALKVNAFDQPDVQSAKDRTKAILEGPGAGVAPKKSALLPSKFIASIKKGDYFGLLAFLPYRESFKQRLERFRVDLRSRTRAAATLGFGPRYLHSTGQLHKGGPDNGVFLLITAPVAKELAIPGQTYGFKMLELAQAMGDLEALESKGRRVVHLRLKELSERALDEALEGLS